MNSLIHRTERIPAIPLEMAYLRDEAPGTRFQRSPVSRTGELDPRALCVFLANGMFLGTDTYFRDVHTVRPGEVLGLDAEGMVRHREQQFSWQRERAEPHDATTGDWFERLDALLEACCIESLEHGGVLALSGGLDSRSLAAVLASRPHAIQSYSYAFEGRGEELKYGREISRICGFPHTEFTIPAGYLWRVIERFAPLTHCHAEFTHPRQMAVIDQLAELGDTFYLGHWGDVLFDDFGLPPDADTPAVVDLAFSRLHKASGLWLAGELWRAHGLPGTFREYLVDRLHGEVDEIAVVDANARLRAFKSLHWAPRWTSVNLSIFSAAGRLVVPYYTDAMCELVRSVPESHLKDRFLQIEYIKRKHPRLAEIPWQQWAPFNLHTWKSLLGISGIPVRMVERLKKVGGKVLRRPLIRQNWQNQFLGADNARQLSGWLLETPELADIVPPRLVREALQRFLQRPREHWHAVSMLLTLAVFARNKQRWIEHGD